MEECEGAMREHTDGGACCGWTSRGVEVFWLSFSMSHVQVPYTPGDQDLPRALIRCRGHCSSFWFLLEVADGVFPAAMKR